MYVFLTIQKEIVQGNSHFFLTFPLKISFRIFIRLCVIEKFCVHLHKLKIIKIMNRHFNIFTLIIVGILFSFSGCEKKTDVTGVKIHPPIAVVKVNETKELMVIVSPGNADDKSVRWTVNTIWMITPIETQEVASISETGKVTGLAEGCASVACITNNMFCEAASTVYVGYAAAIEGNYSGPLLRNEKEFKPTAQIGIERVSEYIARFNIGFLAKRDSCDVKVDYVSENMRFSGETTIELEGVTTSVKVSGAVSLDGLGDFKILVGDDAYSFAGTKVSRKPN
jgi:hypothetical protein